MTSDKWNGAAQSYAEAQDKSEYVRQNADFVRKRFSSVSGMRVLDMGCGHGSFTKYFSEAGAYVIGCDGSEKMLEIAKSTLPEVRFDIVDITGPLPYENESFDVVFCNPVLMDIGNAEAAVGEAARVLKSGGIFWFSIVHPAFYDGEWLSEGGREYAKSIERYRSQYSFENNFWGATTHFHRPISYYLNTAAEHGLVFVRTDEPKAYNGTSRTDEIPLFMYAEFKKR